MMGESRLDVMICSLTVAVIAGTPATATSAVLQVSSVYLVERMMLPTEQGTMVGMTQLES